jgi:hypothetical protein
MTADELATFVAEVRAEVDAIVARLESVEPDTLPPEARAMYDEVRRQADELRTMSEAHVIELLEAACVEAGRELTPAELRGLLGLQ